jgi:hypothetical protein
MIRATEVVVRVPTLLLLASVAGCPADDLDGPGPKGEVTWHRDVRPIVERSCVRCHADGGIAPFSLEDDPAAWADGPPSWAPLVVHAVEARAMPPWNAATDCHPIDHVERLADDEVAAFTAWAAGGYDAGDAADFAALATDAPPDPGPPDVLLEAGVDYTPTTIVPDDYHCLAVGEPFDADTLIRAIDVRPGQRSVVHHAIAYLVPANAAAAVEEADAAWPGPGYPCYGGPVPDGTAGAQHLHAWVPGASPEILPEGDARRLDAGSRIVLQLHYNTLQLPDGAAPPADRTSVALWRYEGEPLGLVATVPLANPIIPIPAGQAHVEHHASFDFHTPALVVGMAGHMHQLGTEIRVDVRHPDGSSDCVLDVPDWDFAWQRTYRFPVGQPYSLAADDTVELTCVYDNSAEHQPVVDGERVTPEDRGWGEGTLDEMCLAYAIVRFGGALGGAEGCGPFQACFGVCPEGDGDCLLTCLTGAANECGVCALVGLGACGAFSCRDEAAALQGCLDGCTDPGAPLGCLIASCRDETATYLSCQDPHVRAGACNAFVRACGLSF